jgi:hypothetical protein
MTKSQPQPPTSRRRVPRREFECPVGVLLHGQYQMERAYQVGEGGMMISCQGKMEEGTQMVINFFLKPGVLVIVRGVVRGVVAKTSGPNDRYGIEFLNLGFQFKREIRNFVAAAKGLDGPV